jgi:hypothetical protein
VVGHVDVVARHDNFHCGIHLVLTEVADFLEQASFMVLMS